MSYYKPKDPIVKEAAKYIALLNRIIAELNRAKGTMEESRKTVLQKKAAKYKSKIEELMKQHGERA